MKPEVMYKQMVLLDREHGKMQTYFLPILPRLSCLTERSQFNFDHSVLEYAELDLSKIGENSIFNLAEASRNFTVVRFDLLESMLKRGAKGFWIEELDTIGEKGNRQETM